MPAINKFYQFATLASSDNILSDGQYEADDQRLSGNVPGIARQQLVNKCLKQAAAIAYAFGEAASVNNNMEVSDDGAGLTNITDYLTKALLPGYSASDANKYARINSQGTGIVYVTIPPASTTVAGLTRYATTTEANAGTIADAAVTPAGLKAFSDGHQNITGNAATASKLQTARTITLSGNDASGSVSFDGSANVQLPVAVAQATKLRTPRSIGISAFNAPAVPFDGTANIDLGVDSIPVNLLDGVISQANLPRIVFTEVVDVANQAARFALTKTQVQNGDMVYQLDTQVMYIVVNDDMLGSEDGYKVIGGQVASKAIADQNGNVIDTYYLPKGGGTLTGTLTGTTFVGALSGNATTATTLATARTIGLSGVTAAAQSFNGSANIVIPISAIPATLLTGTIAAARLPQATEAVIGGARIATTAEANAGTIADAAVTPAGLKAFSDGHQNITGNAATASKLQTARTITLSGNDASGSVSFDGSANVQLPVAVAQATKLRTPRSIGISAFNAPAVPFDGTANIDLGVDSIPVNLLDGVISQANLPRIVFTEVVDVANQAARFALTKTQVQNGDMVYQLDTQVMYIVVNDDMLGSEDGYKVIGGQVASKAIADQNGNVIDTYYLPKGGGTLTGTLTGTTFVGALSGNATTATTLATARTIGLSGVTAAAQSFNGSANIVIPISAIPATLLTGTIAAARLPQATEAVIGGARIATTAEATAGTDNTTIMTPAKVKAYVDTSVGGSFTAATFTEKLQLLTTSAASLDVNFVNGNVVAFTLTRDITLSFTALAPSSVSQSRTVSFIITNGGAFSITWPSNITWLNGTAPTLKASGIDIVTLISPNEGINWYAVESGGGGGGGGTVITVSTSAPSGGAAGDLWVQIPA